MFYLSGMEKLKKGTQEWKDAIAKGRRKDTCDENYFENIDTESKAYHLGLMYADGHNNRKKCQIVVNLQEIDKDVLEKFKESIKYTGNLSIWKKPAPRGNQIALAIVSKKLSEDLEKQGCAQQKTHHLKYPYHISKELQKHFVRGFFDGDGSISKSKKYAVNFSMIGTSDMCIGIAQYLSDKLGKEIRVTNWKEGKYSTNNIRYVRLSGKKDIKKIMDDWYEEAAIYMDRKYQKYYQLFYIEKLADYEKYTSNSHAGKNGGNSKPVIQCDMDGNEIKRWKSVNDAQRAGYNGGYICTICKGKGIMHKGYKWKYAV